MIVVDTNILAYLWLPGPFQDEAKRALDKDGSWASVPLWKSEFRNIVTEYIRKRIISFNEGLDVIRDAESQMKDAEIPVPSEDVMQKVKQSVCSAYDCEFVALAEQLGCRLLTNDKKIQNNFPDMAVSLKEYLDT